MEILEADDKKQLFFKKKYDINFEIQKNVYIFAMLKS
jgi:hypothetical protein